MTKTSTTIVRKPWVRPTVQKIGAGQAESGTRSNSNDASFSTS